MANRKGKKNGDESAGAPEPAGAAGAADDVKRRAEPGAPIDGGREGEGGSVGEEADSLRVLAESIAALLRHAATYAQLRTDQVQVAVRDRIRQFIAHTAAVVVALAVMVVSTVFLMLGIALGIASVAGNRVWLGYALCGLLFLTGAAASLFAWRYRVVANAARRLMAQYPQRGSDASREVDLAAPQHS